MNNKIVAKKYIISALGLMLAFFIITFALIFVLVKTGNSNFTLTTMQIFALSLACAYVPVGAYTGFCISLIPIKELNNRMKILIVFFFPLVLCGIILIGNIMLIPTVLKAIKTIKGTA